MAYGGLHWRLSAFAVLPWANAGRARSGRSASAVLKVLRLPAAGQAAQPEDGPPNESSRARPMHGEGLFTSSPLDRPASLERGRVRTFTDVDATSAGECSAMHLVAVADEEGEVAKQVPALQVDVHLAKLLLSGCKLTANPRTPRRLASSRGHCLPASGVAHSAGLISSQSVLQYSGSPTCGRRLLANPFGQI